MGTQQERELPRERHSELASRQPRRKSHNFSQLPSVVSAVPLLPLISPYVGQDKGSVSLTPAGKRNKTGRGADNGFRQRTFTHKSKYWKNQQPSKYCKILYFWTWKDVPNTLRGEKRRFRKVQQTRFPFGKAACVYLHLHTQKRFWKKTHVNANSGGHPPVTTTGCLACISLIPL